MTINDKLKILRIAKGLTQSQVADRAGLSQAHVAQIESGKMKSSIDTLSKIAEAVGAGLDVHLRLSHSEVDTKLKSQYAMIPLQEFLAEKTMPICAMSEQVRKQAENFWKDIHKRSCYATLLYAGEIHPDNLKLYKLNK